MITNVFSGLQPTGSLHLGNYFGAIRPMIELQDDPTNACRYAVVDLHSLTVEHDPRRLTELTFEVAGVLVACGIDPDRSVLFLQSQVAAHAELAYLMEATAAVGEMQRMVQFKEKADQQASARVALLTYPALMAADILAYDTEVVPVGADQRQHLELARALAQRFNSRYGETFVIPAGAYPRHVARVMDLVDPTRKMGKSSSSLAGVIALLDPPHVVERKIARATTDVLGQVRFAPGEQPGVSNLLAMLSALTDAEPIKVAESYDSYAALKRDVADAVIALLEPLQRRYALVRSSGELDVVLRDGAEQARQIAGPTVARARRAMGLAPAA